MLQWMNENRKTYIIKTALRISILFVAVFCFCNFIGASPASAQASADYNVANPSSTLNEGLEIIKEPLGLPSTDVRVIFFRIIRIALGFVGIIMVVLIIYAGFLWMTAGGNDEQVGKAKKIIINAVIGLAIILSAYSIVWFIMRLLGIGSGNNNPTISGPTATVGSVRNFSGSGALGRIVKDHYPDRDQTGIARNSKIIITFSRGITSSSLITDTNQNGLLGDCVTPASGLLNWETNCDTAIFDENHIKISRVVVDEDGRVAYEAVRGAAILASHTLVDNEKKLTTIVLRPFDYLGSTTTEEKYLVHLGNGIKLDDSTRSEEAIFDYMKNVPASERKYEWTYTYGTGFDNIPPRVVGVYPKNGRTSPKNTAIQIQFSEPVDPIGIQGSFETGQSTYYLSNVSEALSYIYLMKASSTIPTGNFSLINGYQTLEFVPGTPCAVNNCGGKIYCLPVCDLPGLNCHKDIYDFVLKAATIQETGSFESYPFTGIADVAGQALDGNNSGTTDRAGAGIAVKNPDNYYWNFILEDRIEIAPLILTEVIPGLNAANVGSRQLWQMSFDRRLLADSAYEGISIEEKPSHDIPLWKTPRITMDEITSTSTVSMQHGDFLDGTMQYYFPILTSDIVDVNFNCFHPGRGPKLNADGNLKSNCVNDANCCDVSIDPLCCNGETGGDWNSTTTCAEYLKDNSSL